jgi:hypothetical protein
MKKIVTLTALIAASAGAYAQGLVSFNNTGADMAAVAITVSNNPNAYFTGNATFSLWDQTGATSAVLPSDLSGHLTSVEQLIADGFTQVGPLLNLTVTAANAGSFSTPSSYNVTTVGGVGGGPAVLAVVAWTGNYTTLAAAETANALVGAVAFVQSTTGNPNSAPPGTPSDLTGWNATGLNLSVVPVPEPATFALAGLGIASMLIARRRK